MKYRNCRSVNLLIKAPLRIGAIIHKWLAGNSQWELDAEVISLVVIPWFFCRWTPLRSPSTPCPIKCIIFTLIWHTHTHALPPSCTLHPAISVTDWQKQVVLTLTVLTQPIAGCRKEEKECFMLRDANPDLQYSTWKCVFMMRICSPRPHL